VETLRITEIFYSLQGESLLSGIPTVFVRLTGCPLRCNYCDTEYAFTGGNRMTIEDITENIKSYKCHNVCVTGGEPLAQKPCHNLLSHLCDMGYQVSLETSGAIAVDEVDHRVIKVMDLKTPNSGEMLKNRMENLEFLNPQDQIKFVICNQRDYQWAKLQLEEFSLTQICTILFSPSANEQNPSELARWILDDHLSVRFQMQLHKLLWGDQQGV